MFSITRLQTLDIFPQLSVSSPHILIAQYQMSLLDFCLCVLLLLLPCVAQLC
jgi:hypothetical protein